MKCTNCKPTITPFIEEQPSTADSSIRPCDEKRAITDKPGYAARWLFSPRHIDNLIAQGLPHLKIGQRRVRIVVADADAWMKDRYGTRRTGLLPGPKNVHS